MAFDIIRVDGTNGDPGLDFQRMAYSPSLGLFVFVGDDEQVATSSDGLVWSPGSPGLPSGSYRDLVWADDLNTFAAVQNESIPTTDVVTSPSGETWTIRKADDQFYNNIARAPGLFVVVEGSTFPSDVATSVDGISWTSITNPHQFEGLNRLLWVQDLGTFVGVGGSSDYGKAYLSTDGVSWTTINMPSLDSEDDQIQYHDVAWSPTLNLLVAVSSPSFSPVAGQFKNRIATSPNGVSWTIREAFDGGFAEFKRSVAWCPGFFPGSVDAFIALINGDAGSPPSPVPVLYSLDGINWEFSTQSINTFLNSAVYVESAGRLFAYRPTSGGATAYYEGIERSGEESPSSTVASGQGIPADTARRMYQLINPKLAFE